MSGRGCWYEDGLRFSCKRCGRCCRDVEEPSYVFLYAGDVERMARHLEMTEEDFASAYLIEVEGHLCLANFEGDCIFYDAEARGCRIYKARPLQCTTWPFWPESLRKWVWRSEVEDFCAGIGRGRLHSREQIDRTAAKMRTATPLRVKRSPTE